MTDQIFQIDFDRALSAKFAPYDKRHGLNLLVLFDHELSKIARQTSDPLLRRIRTQFWREALTDRDGSGTVLAQQLGGCFSDHPVLMDALDDLIETHEKYFDEPHSGELFWYQYNDRQAGLFRLAVIFLQSEEPKLDHVFFKKCGIAFGGVRQLCAGYGAQFETDEQTKEILAITQDAINDLNVDLKALDPLTKAALLPIALVSPYLDLFHSSDRKPDDLHPLKKLWILWRTARKGF